MPPFHNFICALFIIFFSRTFELYQKGIYMDIEKVKIICNYHCPFYHIILYFKKQIIDRSIYLYEKNNLPPSRTPTQISI